MTVCIGAICNDGDNAILVSDRMVTGQYPPIEFEHTRSKIYNLTKSCAALSAGNALKPIEIIIKTKSLLEEMGKAPSIERIVEKMKEVYQFLRANEAEERILKPRTMTTELFYTKGISVLPSDLFNVLDNEFARHNFGIELLVVGVDSSAHIRSIVNPGLINCYDTIGFHAIGIGYLHAIQVFIAHRYNTSCSIEEAINIAYAAKKAAEIAPGVGNETDISLIFADSILEVDPKIIKELSKIHQKVRKSPLDIIRESTTLLSNLIQEIEKEGENNESKETKN